MEQIPHSLRSEKAPAPQMNRRTFFGGIFGSAVVGAIGVNSLREREDEHVEESLVLENNLLSSMEKVVPEAPAETVEQMPEFEQPFFRDYINASALAKKITREEVIFRNMNTGALVKGPVKLVACADYTVSEMTWRYEGAEPVGIPGVWSVPEKKKASKETGVVLEDIEMVHSYLSLERKELEGVNSLQEAALFLMQNLVVDDTLNRSYDAFIDETFAPDFGNDTAFIQPELRRLLKSLIAKESLYSPTAKSNTGARGELQIMPATWKKYAAEGANPTNFHNELPIAVRYFEESYKYLTKNLRNEFDVIKETFFEGKDVFVRDFLTPLMINAYNAGDGNMRHVVEWFIRKYPSVESLQTILGTTIPIEGKDIFYAMTQSAHREKAVPAYKEEASAYALDIYGWDKALCDFSADLQEHVRQLDALENKWGL